MTHPMARKRILLEKVKALVIINQPTPELIAQAIAAMSDVINDMSDQEVRLVLIPLSEYKELYE